MSYAGSETSVRDGKPVELYRFIGTYANFYYTSGPLPITFLGHTYNPIAIKRSEVRSGTQEDDGLDISIDIPASAELPQTYGFSGTPPKLFLTIFRFHRGAPGDFVAYWSGPIANINTSGGVSTLRSPSSLGNALSGNIPNVYYQAPCNHTLYDKRCAVLEALWTTNTTVTAVNRRDITVASLGALAGRLKGGEISLASGERRMIVAQAGNVVSVNFPFFGLVNGTAVTIVAGCDHAYNGDCKNVFDNQPNFGGFPFIPSENVFQSGMEPGQKIADNTCLPEIFVPDDNWLTVRYIWGQHLPDGSPYFGAVTAKPKTDFITGLRFDLDLNGTYETSKYEIDTFEFDVPIAPHRLQTNYFNFPKAHIADDFTQVFPLRFTHQLQIPLDFGAGEQPRSALVQAKRWNGDWATVNVVAGGSGVPGCIIQGGAFPFDYVYEF